jgi:hypothetical protein
VAEKKPIKEEKYDYRIITILSEKSCLFPDHHCLFLVTTPSEILSFSDHYCLFGLVLLAEAYYRYVPHIELLATNICYSSALPFSRRQSFLRDASSASGVLVLYSTLFLVANAVRIETDRRRGYKTGLLFLMTT